VVRVTVGGGSTADRPGPLALARRLDWRFLLADPALGRVVVAGSPDRDLVPALEEFAESVALETAGTVGEADLAIVHGPTAVELRAAVDRVAPGGWIVVELVGRARARRSPRLTTSSVDAVEGRLRHDGFVDVASYWTWPDQADCREIVPLDEPALVRLSLARRRSDRRARLKARLAGVVFRVGLGPAIVPAVTVVARRSSSTGSSGPTIAPLVDTYLAANRVRLGLESFGVGRPASLLVTPRFQASAHVVALVVPSGAERPSVVVKLQRLSGPARTLAAEAACLRALVDVVPGGVPGVPRLLADEPIGGHAAVVETALTGRPLDPGTVRRDRDGTVALVGRWVRGLRRADGPPPGDDRWSRLVEPALSTLADDLADDPEDVELVGRVGALLEPLRTTPLPLVAEHGDLSHPNLLRLDTGLEPRIGAIDWELGEPAGLPLVDFLFFLGYVAVATGERRGSRAAVAPEEQARLIETAFGGPGSWAAVAAARQADSEGVDRALLGPLLVATWSRALARLGARLDGETHGFVGRAVSHKPEDAALAGRRLRGHRYYPIWRRVVAVAPTIEWGGHG
jgi:Phosphotransferase enzyme family